MPIEDAERAIQPLRWIFWGGLLCVFDLTITQAEPGGGYRCDVLSDALGLILISIAVVRLRAIGIHERYDRAMKAAGIVAIVSAVVAFAGHVLWNRPLPVQLALGVLGLVQLGAIVAFCRAMRWFCEEAALRRAAESWKLTQTLFVLIYLLPLGLFRLRLLFAIADRQPFHFDLGPAGLLLLLVFAVPVVHVFISTSRMIHGIEASGFPLD